MKIMVALDLSDYADFVLVKAIKTAKQQDAKMDIVIVAGEDDRKNEIEVQKATLTAESYRKKALAKGVAAKVRVLTGKSPADEIIKYQQLENLDLIVIGRKARKEKVKSPIGTVARDVAAYATCTVMVVRCR